MVSQAKMTIYVTRRNKTDNLYSQDLVLMFKNLMTSRITVDFIYCEAMEDLETFALQWGYNDVLCVVVEEDFIFNLLL